MLHVWWISKQQERVTVRLWPKKFSNFNTQDGQGRCSEEYEQFLAEDIITDETAYLRMLEFGFLVWLQQEGLYKRTNLTCLYSLLLEQTTSKPYSIYWGRHIIYGLAWRASLRALIWSILKIKYSKPLDIEGKLQSQT